MVEDGNRVNGRGHHRWVSDLGRRYTIVKVHRGRQQPHLTINNFIRGSGQAYETPPETEAYKRGYLAGMIRGDGLLAKYDYSGRYKRHNKKQAQRTEILHQFRLALSDFEALKRTKA